MDRHKPISNNIQGNYCADTILEMIDIENLISVPFV